MANMEQTLVPPKILKNVSLWDRLVFDQMFYAALGFEKTTQKINQAAGAQENLNNEVTEGAEETNKLKNALGMLNKAYSAVKFIANVSVVPAAEQQALEDLFKIKVGNPEVGTGMFEKFKQDALKSGMDVNESLNNALSFMSVTKNSDQISELNGFADRLSKLTSGDKSSGDATAAIMSAMQGDTSSLAKEFNIPEANIKQFSAEIAASKGNLDTFVASMDGLLQKSGITQEALSTMMDSPVNKWQQLLGNVNNAFVSIGSGALESLVPIMDMINGAFESGALDPFINALSMGLSLLTQGFLWLAEAVPPAWEFIKGVIMGVGAAIWNLITIFMGLLPVIAAVGVFLAVLQIGFHYGAIKAYALSAAQTIMAVKTNLVAGATKILNMVMKANPIMWFISAIIAIIAAFGAWKVVTMGLKQVFSNAFGFIMDVAETAVNFVIGMINGLIKGVNAVSGFFANLLGIESKQIAEIEFRADYSKIKEKGQDFIEDFSMDDFTKKFMPDKQPDPSEDILDDWNKNQAGADVAYPKTTPGVVPSNGPMPSAPMPKAPVPVSPTGGSIDSIGKVDNSVDVASEDLKVMRDLAEVNAISNMITLTPTVQMTTGDINSGADLDTILSRINRTLEEQFVSSAEGVYL
ncbi:MAG: hypothetical protein ACQEXX_21260 [Bacillota bacterium]